MPPRLERPRPDKAVATDLVSVCSSQSSTGQRSHNPTLAVLLCRGSTAPNTATPFAIYWRSRSTPRRPVAERHRWTRFRQQRGRADALADAHGAVSWRGRERSARWRSHARKACRCPKRSSCRTDRNQNVRISDDLPLGSRGGVALRYYFPADGEYLFEMRPKESGAGGGFEGITAEPHQLDTLRSTTSKSEPHHLGRTRFRSTTWRRSRRLPARGPDEENSRADERSVCRSRPRISHGAGVLRLERRQRLSKTSSSRRFRREPYRDGSGEPRISSLTNYGAAADDSVGGRYREPPAGSDVRPVVGEG